MKEDLLEDIKKSLEELRNNIKSKDISDRLKELKEEEFDKEVSKVAKTSGDMFKVLDKVEENKSKYKSIIKKVLSKALGYKDDYQMNVASARVEGEFGREVDVPDMKSIVLLIDCSSSQGPSKYKELLEEVETFASVAKGSNLKVYAIFWGGSAYYKKYDLKKGVTDRIKSDSKSLGTTFLCKGIDVAMELPKSDLYMILTDGEIFDTTIPVKTKAWLLKNKPKLFWVFNSRPDGAIIKRFDSTFKDRSIVIRRR